MSVWFVSRLKVYFNGSFLILHLLDHHTSGSYVGVTFLIHKYTAKEFSIYHVFWDRLFNHLRYCLEVPPSNCSSQAYPKSHILIVIIHHPINPWIYTMPLNLIDPAINITLSGIAKSGVPADLLAFINPIYSTTTCPTKLLALSRFIAGSSILSSCGWVAARKPRYSVGYSGV